MLKRIVRRLLRVLQPKHPGADKSNPKPPTKPLLYRAHGGASGMLQEDGEEWDQTSKRWVRSDWYN